MPKTITKSEIPAVVRQSVDSPHRANVLALQGFLAADGDKAALVYDASDGVTSETLGGTMQALRNAAKAAGHRLRLRWTDTKGLLYVVTDGEYVPMDPEKAAARAAKRAETQAAKAADQPAKAAAKRR